MNWKATALEHARKDAPHESCGLVAVYKGKKNIILVIILQLQKLQTLKTENIINKVGQELEVIFLIIFLKTLEV